jgi:AbrB family looped-hinge helix DNA binding protein
MTQEPEVTTVSEKGQVVIPQALRKEMGIKPKTKFLVFGRGNTLIMKRLELPDIKQEWEEIFRMMDRKELQLTQKEVQAEVEANRRERRNRKR